VFRPDPAELEPVEHHHTDIALGYEQPLLASHQRQASTALTAFHTRLPLAFTDMADTAEPASAAASEEPRIGLWRQSFTAVRTDQFTGDHCRIVQLRSRIKF